MSLFPSLRPTARSFQVGALPVNTYQSLSGKEVQVVLGDTMAGHGLTLTFGNIQEPVVKQVTDHWYGQSGTALAFNLPAAVWAGWTEYESAITPTQKWRYTAAPQITAVSPGIMNVSVSLVSLA